MVSQNYSHCRTDFRGVRGASPENVLEFLGHKLKRQLIVELRNVLISFSQYRISIAENRIYILKVNNQLMRIPVYNFT